jgi:RimJ/RimL family protein N-acetyltransferase
MIRRSLLRREGVTAGGRRFLLRPTRGEDAEALVRLRDAVAAEREFIAAVPGERSVVEEGLALAGLLAEGGLSLTLEVDGGVAGHLLVHRRNEPGETSIGDVAIIVENAHRGAGLGRALMETAIDWSRRVGLEKLCLGVFTGNQRAISLYRSLGFREEGTQHTRVHLPDGERELLLMGLRLEDRLGAPWYPPVR